MIWFLSEVDLSAGEMGRALQREEGEYAGDGEGWDGRIRPEQDWQGCPQGAGDVDPDPSTWTVEAFYVQPHKKHSPSIC